MTEYKLNAAKPGDGPISTDMIIIGAGPVGLFTVFEAGLLDMRCHLIDALDKPGGQCAELYPEKPIYDIPGIPVCTGQELTEGLLKQIEPFDPVFHFNQQAEKLKKIDSGWQLETSEGTTLQSKNIVIAAGGGSFVPKKLPMPTASEFENKSIYYAVRQRSVFEGKRLVIAGGGDSALDWALNLHEIAEKVTLIHRRDQFRATPDSVTKMRELVDAGKMDLVIGQINTVYGQDGEVEALGIKKSDRSEIRLDCNALLAFYGLTMKLGPIVDWGLNLHENLITVDTEKFETSTPGIFAIGDICTYPGKLKLILSGFHEAALMCQQAYHYAFPDKKLIFRYTTSSSALHEKLGV